MRWVLTQTPVGQLQRDALASHANRDASIVGSVGLKCDRVFRPHPCEITIELLGAATYVGPDLALTFRSVPKSIEMVDPRVNARTAVTIENSTAEPFVTLVTGDRFAARLVVDGSTRAPTHIEYTGQDKSPVVVTFSDRREVAGLLMPFRIVTTSNGRLVDELVLDEILVNPELSKSDFKR